MMKRRPITVLLALALCACNRDEEPPQTEARPDRPAAKAPAARKAVFPEAEAAAVMRAISYAEIAMATAALDITQSEAVLAYARVIAADHRGIAQLVDSTTTGLGQLAMDNAMSTELRIMGDSITGQLRRLPRAFNNTFMEEQVKANQQALQILDTALIPSARAPQLKTLFQAIRPTMVAHLQRSLQILSERKKAAQERGEPWESGLDLAPLPPPRPVAPEPADTYVDPYPIRPRPDTGRSDTIRRN